MKVNKKIIKLLFLFILLTININVFALDDMPPEENNSHHYVEKVNNYKVLIEDDENLIDESKIKSLAKEMSKLTEYGNIAFKSTSVTTSSTEYYARNYYHDKFGTESGTLFLIDMNNRKIYIFSDGYNYKYITKDKSLIITDNTYKYASRGDYYTCSVEAYKQMGIVLSNGKIAEPMRYISNALISITIGSFIAFYIAIKMTQIKKVQDVELLKCINSHLILSNIDANVIGSHRVYSPVSDGGSSGGGSSGGGGGGGGGGGSSGGGGGHSF